MTPDQDYWKERFTQLEAAAHREAEKVYADLHEAYREAERKIQADISVWYQRFANNNGGISMQEARKLLTSGQLKEFKWTVQEYIQHGRENGVSANWMKELENASARFHITRLQAIQMELQNTVEVLYGNQLDQIDGLMKQQFLDSYYRTAYTIQKGVGVGWDIAGVNRKAIDAVIHRPWTTDGKNFSTRIWGNKAALIGDLQKTLTQSIMLGKHPSKFAEDFAKRMGTDEKKAARLLFTESAYISAVADEACFKDLGVGQFVFIATLDERTSEICQSMDGQVFEMKDYQVGVTVPPLHPWCRSTTAPYYQDLAGIGNRAARDPDTGKTYYIPKETKYSEWKQAFTPDPKTGETGSKEGFKEVRNVNVVNDPNCALAQRLGDKAYNAMQKMVGESSNDDLKQIWSDQHGSVMVGSVDTSYQKQHCEDDTIFVNAKRNAKGTSYETQYQVNFHESAHAIDYLLRDKIATSDPNGMTHASVRWKDGLFPKTIVEEVKGLVDAKEAIAKADWNAHSGDWNWLYEHGYIDEWKMDYYRTMGRWPGIGRKPPEYDRSIAFAMLEREVQKIPDIARADLSDILEGATLGKIKCGYGHGVKYWSRRMQNEVSKGLACEAFAEMSSAECSNHESLETIKKYIPKSYKTYCEMLGDLVK